jgi:hypothetical protein
MVTRTASQLVTDARARTSNLTVDQVAGRPVGAAGST